MVDWSLLLRYVEREIEDVTLTRRQKEMCDKNECPQDSKQGSVEEIEEGQRGCQR